MSQQIRNFVIIFFLIGWFKLTAFKNTENPNYWNILLNSEKSLKTIKITSILTCFAFVIYLFLGELKPFVSQISLSKKIKEQNFDYHSYCTNLTVIDDKNSVISQKTGNVLNFTDKAQKRFVCACMYNIDATTKTPHIISAIIQVFLAFMFVIFASLGLYVNAEAYVSTILMTGSAEAFSFQFNTHLIVSCILLVIEVVLSVVYDFDSPEKWLKKYQTK